MGKHPLAFLGKKSWHTKNLRNVEKVWIADEKDAAEAKKLADLQRQIIEERQMDELREMQAASGSRKVRSERLDWMYEGPMSSAQDAEQADEYLLGKAFEATAEKAEVSELISRNSEQPGALLSAAPARTGTNEAFSRLHEDPMMMIRKQELKARESVVKNPLKMAKVKKEIEAQLRGEREQHKDAKRKRKEDKKARKREKKESKKESKRAKKEETPHRRRSASSSSSGESECDRRPATLKPVKERDPRYGLQRGTAQVFDRSELGPSAEERRAKANKDEPRVDAQRRYRRVEMSATERSAKLAEMQADALEHDQRLSERCKFEKSAKDAVEETGLEKGDPSFLKAMEKDVYLSGNIDLEERVKRNRQNHQRGAELGSSGFMRQ